VVAEIKDKKIQRHSIFEDLFGLLSGSILFSVGLSLLHASGVLTGGTAGVALLVANNTSAQVGTVYLLIGIPFLLLALWKKGWRFTLRSSLNLAFVSFLTNEMPKIFEFQIQNKFVATIIANILLGVGMIVIFRHFSSLGGFNVIALLAQERLSIKAGYVQLSLDAIVLLSGLSSYSPQVVLMSLVGCVILNMSLAVNHRSDRYVGYST
jgi:uncharacterized membrane-anchored protein YitT (DUF2179 family)